MTNFILDYIDTLVKFLLVMTPILVTFGGMFFLYEKRVEGSTKLFTKWSKFCNSLFGE